MPSCIFTGKHTNKVLSINGQDVYVCSDVQYILTRFHKEVDPESKVMLYKEFLSMQKFVSDENQEFVDKFNEQLLDVVKKTGIDLTDYFDEEEEEEDEYEDEYEDEDEDHSKPKKVKSYGANDGTEGKVGTIYNPGYFDVDNNELEEERQSYYKSHYKMGIFMSIFFTPGLALLYCLLRFPEHTIARITFVKGVTIFLKAFLIFLLVVAIIGAIAGIAVVIKTQVDIKKAQDELKKTEDTLAHLGEGTEGAEENGLQEDLNELTNNLSVRLVF